MLVLDLHSGLNVSTSKLIQVAEVACLAGAYVVHAATANHPQLLQQLLLMWLLS